MERGVAHKVFKTTISDNELNNLIDQYAKHYYLKFKHVWKMNAEKDEIIGELALKACEAKKQLSDLRQI